MRETIDDHKVRSTARPFVRQRATGLFWYGKWYRSGKPVIRALGRAWVTLDGHGSFKPRRGRPVDGALSEAQAGERMLALMRQHDAQQTRLELDADTRRREGITFRELAAEYLAWLAEVKDAKPSTLAGHRYLLAEPGTPHRRGGGKAEGAIMAALGDMPVRTISTRDIESLLRTVAGPRKRLVTDETGRKVAVTVQVAPRTVNVHRQLICAIFNYGMRPSTYGLSSNPARFADRRREPEYGPVAFYSPEQVEALARALAAGAHRDPNSPKVDEPERTARARDDARDAELIRVAAYTGLRRGELIALRWRDVDFSAHKLTVRRTLSGAVESSSTKSRRVREVPLPDQAAAALERLRQRPEFTAPDQYVFPNRLGRRLDPTALRRRYERARDAAGLQPLRFHDLRHTYGSLLVAGGIDLQSVKAAMGHSRITTTERYLHARPATEQAARFTVALAQQLPAGGEHEQAS
ncbi:site-specific integrase [Conexibacter sp. S30A1]|uniref:tyrosine-type recombinase/integrase n=1 Tax=Conexibacter sp. S30A1 TaxID=2937800 RepID=UPI0020102F48|nr:site-specific integrase [Conexibacter sp. S30A1]